MDMISQITAYASRRADDQRVSVQTTILRQALSSDQAAAVVIRDATDARNEIAKSDQPTVAAASGTTGLVVDRRV